MSSLQIDDLSSVTVDYLLETSRTEARNDGLPKTRPWLKWERSALSLLPIRGVNFEAVRPTDQEKLRGWHPLLIFSPKEILWYHFEQDLVVAEINIVEEDIERKIRLPIPDSLKKSWEYSSYSKSKSSGGSFLLSSDVECFEEFRAAQRKFFDEELVTRAGFGEKNRWEVLFGTPNSLHTLLIKETSIEFETFKYKWSKTQGESIDITVPYIQYEEYLCSSDYRAGLPYAWYIRVDIKSLGPHAMDGFQMDEKSHPIRTQPDRAGITAHIPEEAVLVRWCPSSPKVNGSLPSSCSPEANVEFLERFPEMEPWLL
jgi:hypothetical protein